MTQSCLVANFRKINPVSDRDAELLLALEKEERHFAPGALVQDQNSESRDLFSVKSGWVQTFALLEDGKRQILEIKLPGDLIGLRDAPFHEALSGIGTLTEAVLCPFPKRRLAELFDEAPHVARMMFMFESWAQAILIERIANLGQRDAYGRLCHFLVELQLRLRLRGEDESHFRLPMTQRQLADYLGITEVHVGRVLRQVKDDGLATIADRQATIHDLKRLRETSGFNPAYLQMDDAWALPTDRLPSGR